MTDLLKQRRVEAKLVQLAEQIKPALELTDTLIEQTQADIERLQAQLQEFRAKRLRQRPRAVNLGTLAALANPLSNPLA